jgi:hypothetical protein
MPYYYKKAAKEGPVRRLNRIPQRKEDEGLTGFVHGLEASDLEERYARGLDQYGKEFEFQYEVYTAYTLPGEQKKVDFLVNDGEIYFPEEVDAAFTHKTAEQKSYDRIRDEMIDEHLKTYGFQPVKRIDGDRLQTQGAANTVVAELHG